MEINNWKILYGKHYVMLPVYSARNLSYIQDFEKLVF